MHLRQWPIDRLIRKRGFNPHDVVPLVLVRTVAGRQLVVIGCPRAYERGVRPGMALAEARAMCPGLAHRPYAPHHDRKAMLSLARWMMRFSPIVACGPDEDSAAIFLDVAGCERIFGGMGNLVEQVIEAMRNLRIHARIAVAPTIGAAWAVAVAGSENGRVVLPEQLPGALAPLPPAALRLDEPIVHALHHLGIRTIGQLLKLPRAELPARFGAALLLRLDQAMGTTGETLVPLDYEPPIEARVDFDGVIDSLEAIWMVFKDLSAEVIAQLAHRGSGARKLELDFFRDGAGPIRQSIGLSRPSRNAANLFNLMRCAMEGLERKAQAGAGTRARRNKSLLATGRWQSPTSNVPAGFTGIRLSVSSFDRLSAEQITLLGQEEHDGGVELGHLIERLSLRMGDESVVKARLVESYLPERAYLAGGSCFSQDERPTAGHPSVPAIRPLRLLNRPMEIRVMISPSHDRDGRPISINGDGRFRKIVHAIGPERISGQWWEGHHKTRDYFAVEDDAGRRSWVFRVNETGKWYVHGEFE